MSVLFALNITKKQATGPIRKRTAAIKNNCWRTVIHNRLPTIYSGDICVWSSTHAQKLTELAHKICQ